MKSVLSLKSERYENKVLFSTFSEHLKIYVFQHYKFPHDLVPIIEKYLDPKDDIEADIPNNLTEREALSEVNRWIKKSEVEEHMDRQAALVKNKMAMYGHLCGQCTTVMQEVIKCDSSFEENDMKYDIIWLLQKCKLVVAGLDEKANVYHTLLSSIQQVFNITQHENESNDAYRTRWVPIHDFATCGWQTYDVKSVNP